MKDNATNPLLEPSGLPFGAPRFDAISLNDYMPAFKAAIAKAKEEIKAIASNPEPATFANTIEALETAGSDLDRVSGIFYNLCEACTNDEMDAIAEELSPMMTAYSMSILHDADLFRRVKAVWENREALDLDQEASKLLSETWKSFIRSGAGLDGQSKERFSKISEELSLATLKFGQNVLADTNAFTLHITDPEDLAGLPESAREAAAAEAAAKGKEGWVFTLNAPSYNPFMQFSERRDLREKMWRAYNTRCTEGAHDNRATVRKIVKLRTEKARLLGYPTYAHYALENRMAKDPDTVQSFIEGLMDASLPAAREEVAEVEAFAHDNGFEGELMPWDFSFWSQKHRKALFDIDDNMLKPYFPLENVQEAVFSLASRLYGLQFKNREDIPVYHPDVRVFEVTSETGRFMALLYIDYFPRESKRGGAWMTAFREMSTAGGKETRPLISIVTNFTKPTPTIPSLLTFSEVTTLLHEFGHALHGMLAEGRYKSLTGTNVVRDFVELPSQLMENWAYEPEYLASFARHWQTGKVIPYSSIDRIVQARNYQAGYFQVRQLQFGITDMAWHTAAGEPAEDVVAFEQEVLAPGAVLPQIPGVAFSTSFNHIFSGGYAAGYYSYKWAEVLEADAFEYFKERGIFSRSAAEHFRKELLSRGGTVDADVLYRNFRGRNPEPEALLRKMGLAKR